MSKTSFAPATLLVLSALTPLAAWADAPQSLQFSSYTQTWGAINTSYNSPYLGQINFQLNGPATANYQYWDPVSSPVPNSLTSFNIAPGQTPGVDPVYDIVTSSGAYGFGYDSQAQVNGTSLHGKAVSSQIDGTLAPVSSTPNSTVEVHTTSSFSQQMYIASTADHPSGSYGAILVGMRLDGATPLSDNYASAQLYTYASFTDAAGVGYSSGFGVSTYAGDASWTGSSTVYKKLLFQYDTSFYLSSYLWLDAYGNSTVDFLNTGKISMIELPYGATLESGAAQAGLGSSAQLYGNVFNAPTLDDPNTNWDFGNAGGGFQVPVPEPGSSLLLATGVALIGWRLRRRRRNRL